QGVGGAAEARNPSLPLREEYRDPVVTTGQSEDTLPLPPAITPTLPHNREQCNRGLPARWMDSLRTEVVAASSMHRGRFSLAHWFMFALFPAILLGAFVFTGMRKRPAPVAPATPEFRVAATADLPGTRFTIDG